MLSPHDTHIVFFGGSANMVAVEAIAKLARAGFDVVAARHDPREANMLREAGIAFIPDIDEALDDANIVISSLSTPSDVEELYLGEKGVLELMEPGTYIMDLSFSTPQLAREIQTMAAIRDIEAVDSPIVNLGEKEEAIAFIGGEPEALRTLSPLFPYLAPTIHPQTSPGEGQFAAMIAYIALAGSLMGAIEAMSLARIAGFADKNAIGAIASTSAGSRALIDYIPRMLANDYSGHIKVADFLDALEVALDAAEDLDVTVPMVETAYQLYDLLSVVGGDALNIQALALLYEDEQTCADYGLDWALADTLSGDGREGMLPGFNLESLFPQDFPFGASADDDDEDGDYHGHGGHDHPGGIPPIGGFFSKN